MNYFLLAALIAAGIYMYWEDKKNWEPVYETTSAHMHEAYTKFSHLKNKGVKCRLRTCTARSRFRVMLNTSELPAVRLEVSKKDLETATKLLSESGDEHDSSKT